MGRSRSRSRTATPAPTPASASASLQRILITGANRGIGLAIAQRLLETSQADVVLGVRAIAAGEAAKAVLCAANSTWRPRVHVLELDVSREESVAAAASEVRNRFAETRPLTALVNNAGIGPDLPWIPQPWPADTARRVIETNLYGAERVVRNFRKLLPGGGRILNISSGAGPANVKKSSAEIKGQLLDVAPSWEVLRWLAERFIIAYEAASERPALSDEGFWLQSYGFSKAVMNAYTRRLAIDEPELIVHVCSPGFIATDMTAEFGCFGDQAMLKGPEAGSRVPCWLLLAQEVPPSAEGLFNDVGKVAPWVAE